MLPCLKDHRQFCDLLPAPPPRLHPGPGGGEDDAVPAPAQQVPRARLHGRRRNLLVQRVEIFGLRAVHVEPPVADEVLLVEQGPIGAEERILDQTASSVVCTNMK